MTRVPTNTYSGKNLVRASETYVCHFSESPLSIFLPVAGGGTIINPNAYPISLFFMRDPDISEALSRFISFSDSLKIYVTNAHLFSQPTGNDKPLEISIAGQTYYIMLSFIPLTTESIQVTVTLYEKVMS